MISAATGVAGGWKFHAGTANAAPGASSAAVAARAIHRASSVRLNAMLFLACAWLAPCGALRASLLAAVRGKNARHSHPRALKATDVNTVHMHDRARTQAMSAHRRRTSAWRRPRRTRADP